MRNGIAFARYAALELLASRLTCTSLFGHGAPIDRSGPDDPDAGRGVCFGLRPERLICRETRGNEIGLAAA